MNKQGVQTGKKRRLNRLELIGMALSSLWSNALRSSLTILGITIGVFSVVAVMTVLSALNRSINDSLQVLNAEVFSISKYPAVMINDGWWNYRDRPNISYREGKRFKAMMEDQSEALVAINVQDGGETVRYEKLKTDRNVTVVGTNENFLLCNGYDITVGRNISANDIEFNRAVTVLGSKIAEKLFPGQNPLGKQVVQEGSRYEVIGVLEEKGMMMGQSQDTLVLIPITRFLANNFSSHRSMSLAVRAPSAEQIDDYKDTAIGNLRVVRKLEPEDDNNFSIFTNDALLDIFGKIAVVVGAGGLIISAIALFTAGVGVMNIMLVSVTERTREIGIRKSIGARSIDVLVQFLLEAVFLSELGGILGILVGVVTGNALAMVMEVPMIFPWFWAFVAVLTCSVIGVVFGCYPAYRASRLHPIDALRYE